MTNQNCLNVRDLSKRFGDKEVLSSISLAINQGEIYGLLGPSGSGKTTLVRCMAGLEEPSNGWVELLQIRLPKRSMLKKLGYMAQADALYEELTADENLRFFGALAGLRGTELTSRITYVLKLTSLDKDRYKRVGAYSGGMKRRLSLAIAFLHEPEVLILDEPTVGIDPVLRQAIWRELQILGEGGTTIIITTHVMDEASKCHRLGMIQNGRLIASGTPSELMQRTDSSTIEQVFLHYGGVGK